MAALKTATLVVNPASGRASLLAAKIPAMMALLREHGYAAEVLETTLDTSFEMQLGFKLLNQATDLVLVCGGDGTVHHVVQMLAGLRSAIPLGVIPLGTANALARDLRVPLDPLRALQTLLRYTPRSIPLGQMITSSYLRDKFREPNKHSQWFTLMAGCGPDGALIHSMQKPVASRLKKRFGRGAYYAHAVRLFLTRRWPVFLVELRRPSVQTWETFEAVAMMTSRVADLGGLFPGLAHGTNLLQPQLRVQILRAPAHLSFPAWTVCARLGLRNPWLTTVDVDEIRCTPLDPRPIHAQVDGEPFGALPFSLCIVPEALWLLMPPA